MKEEEEGVGKVEGRGGRGRGRGEGRATFTSTSGTTTLCWAATAGDAKGSGDRAATTGATWTAPISTRGDTISSRFSTAPPLVPVPAAAAAALSNFLTGAKRVRVRAAAMDCASGARMEAAGVREVMEGRLPPTTLSDGVVVEVEGGIWAASPPLLLLLLLLELKHPH